MPQFLPELQLLTNFLHPDAVIKTASIYKGSIYAVVLVLGQNAICISAGRDETIDISLELL